MKNEIRTRIIGSAIVLKQPNAIWEVSSWKRIQKENPQNIFNFSP